MSDFSARVYRFAFGAAAAYNIAFGLWASLFPRAFFNVFDLDPPRYPAIWACLGMVVGLYGVGYAYAAWRLDRAFPFIAIGLAGKILGPIGWCIAVRSEELPFRTFPLIVFDDLLWWMPFALFLLESTAIAAFVKRNVALICAATHIVASVATLTLRESDPRLMWMSWMIAALSLVGFYTAWAARIPTLVPVAIASAGVVCDFIGESMFITQPQLERFASLITGGAANGLYTLAAILLTVLSPSLPLRWLAWTAWSAGTALFIVTIFDWPNGVIASSAALMIAFVAWLIAFART